MLTLSLVCEQGFWHHLGWPLLPQLTFVRQREPDSCLRRRSLKQGVWTCHTAREKNRSATLSSTFIYVLSERSRL